MDYSAANVALWNPLIQIGIIAVLVIVSNVLRVKVPFVKKSLMPTAVLAGFLLLGLRYTNLIKIDTKFLEMITYHSLAIGFIALSLRVTKKEPGVRGRGLGTAFRSGALIVSTYLIQALVGLVISIVLALTLVPHLFKASGLLLPMGFGQGPGQANNIGTTYETLGFAGGRSYGLAIAACGFLVACIVGVLYLNIGQRRGKFKRLIHDEISGSVTIDTYQDSNEIPISQSIDKLSIQAAFVLLIYLVTYVFTWGVTTLLSTYAPGAANLVNSLLWGFNFIIGTLFGTLFRLVLKKLGSTNLIHHQYQNNYLLNRISGLAFDVMIICGIGTIYFEELKGLWLPFIVTVMAGGAGTFFHLKFMCHRIYGEYYEEGFISMFGMLTGTISSGILLVREIDPNFETPAANNLVTGSSTAIVFGAPMLLLVGMAGKSDKMTYIIGGVVVLYLALMDFIVLFRYKKLKKNSQAEVKE